MNVKRIRVKFDGKEFVADVTRIEKIEECLLFGRQYENYYRSKKWSDY
jgi:hypothetical protein